MRVRVRLSGGHLGGRPEQPRAQLVRVRVKVRVTVTVRFRRTLTLTLFLTLILTLTLTLTLTFMKAACASSVHPQLTPPSCAISTSS